MNLAQLTRRNLRLIKHSSLPAGSVQWIRKDHHLVRHAMAGAVALSLNCATATPGIDRKHLLRVEYRTGDNGRGFDPNNIQPGHHGLSIIRERTIAIGAALTVRSQP